MRQPSAGSNRRLVFSGLSAVSLLFDQLQVAAALAAEIFLHKRGHSRGQSRINAYPPQSFQGRETASPRVDVSLFHELRPYLAPQKFLRRQFLLFASQISAFSRHKRVSLWYCHICPELFSPIHSIPSSSQITYACNLLYHNGLYIVKVAIKV